MTELKEFIILAGVNGTGKSSLRGVIHEFKDLGHIVDPDQIAREHHFDLLQAGKQAIREIDGCLAQGVTFTQETTLAGGRILKELIAAKAAGYTVSMFYVGISSVEESLKRIENRVRKGGHNIPTPDVLRRYQHRIADLEKCVPYCDAINFYDNENGFIKIGVYKRAVGFAFANGYRPPWILEMCGQVDFSPRS